jgi:hypothetical protein
LKPSSMNFRYCLTASHFFKPNGKVFHLDPARSFACNQPKHCARTTGTGQSSLPRHTHFPHQIPKGSITYTDKQHLQPVKERFFSSRPRKLFRSQSSRKISWRFKPLVMT